MDELPVSIGNQTYLSSEIAKAKSPNKLSGYLDLPDYGQEALAFCWQWLKGTDSFSQATSGSTGTPKLISIGRAQMTASISMTAKALGLVFGDRALVCLRASYIAGKMMLARALVVGMPIEVVAPSSNPLKDACKPADFTALVPLQFKTILSEAGNEVKLLNKAKAILVGGSGLSNALEEEIATKISCPVYHTYGMTETVSHVALRRINGVKRSSYYTLLPGIDVKQDQRGCLMIQGAVTNYQWLTTNDLVGFIGKRRFRWLGRADNVINSGGVKIHTEELESQIEAGVDTLGSHRRYFVAGLADERLGHKVCLFVEGDSPSKQAEGELNKWFDINLTAYTRPKRVVYIPKFSLTASGKIKRKEIVENFEKNSK